MNRRCKGLNFFILIFFLPPFPFGNSAILYRKDFYSVKRIKYRKVGFLIFYVFLLNLAKRMIRLKWQKNNRFFSCQNNVKLCPFSPCCFQLVFTMTNNTNNLVSCEQFF